MHFWSRYLSFTLTLQSSHISVRTPLTNWMSIPHCSQALGWFRLYRFLPSIRFFNFCSCLLHTSHLRGCSGLNLPTGTMFGQVGHLATLIRFCRLIPYQSSTHCQPCTIQANHAHDSTCMMWQTFVPCFPVLWSAAMACPLPAFHIPSKSSAARCGRSLQCIPVWSQSGSWCHQKKERVWPFRPEPSPMSSPWDRHQGLHYLTALRQFLFPC